MYSLSMVFNFLLHCILLNLTIYPIELAFSTNSQRIVVQVVFKDGVQSTVEAAGQATNPVHEGKRLTGGLKWCHN